MSAPPPSFSSFPPVFSSFPDTEAGDSERKVNITPSPTEKVKKTKHKKDSKKDRHPKERLKESARDDEVRGKTHKEYMREKDMYLGNDKLHERTSYPAEPTLDLAPHLFYSDRKGDTKNITYGGLHAGDVPKHNLLARGRRVLGLNDAYIVVHRSHHGVEVDVGRKKRRLPELTDHRARRLLQASPTRRLLASSGEEYKYEEVDGFLRLPSAKSSQKDVEEYRDITTNTGSDDSDSSTGDEETDDEDRDAAPLNARQATLRDLEERLTTEPSSVDTWIALLTCSLSVVPLHSKDASKVRAEISLSILTRALAAHPNNQRSVILRLKLLSVGEELWGNERLHEEWEEALKIGNPELWVKWLDWRIRVLRSGIDGIVLDGQRVLAALGMDEVSKLRVLWRIAVAFREAGYVERAMGLLQAQSESTYNRPTDLLLSPFETTLDRLESFWESEVPRAGEPGAVGWASWEASGCPEAIPIPSRAVLGRSNEIDPYSRWAREELLADASTQTPLRSFDDEAANDPYTTILFSDLRPLIVDLTYLGSKQAFRLLWLSFLGLHIPGFSATLSDETNSFSDDGWSATYLTHHEFLDRFFPKESATCRITSDSFSGVLVGRERSCAHSFGPVKHWSFDVLGAMDIASGGRCRLWSREDVRAVDVSLVRRVFQHCRLADREVEWDLLHLAFEGAVDPKQALKISKTFVAKVQDSLPHWRAHANLERLHGKLDDARKVYRTVLSATSANSLFIGQLWWDWAEMEWLNGDSDAALQVALRSTGTNGSGNVVILRSKRELDDACGAVPEERWKEREAWINLRALLELLTSTPSSMLTVVDSALNRVPQGSETHESLTVAALSMLYTHGIILRHPVPPSILRERAEQAIRLYPANTVILGIFLEAERGQGIWGQVGLVLSEKEGEKDMLRTLAEIWAIGWKKGSWRAEQERIRGRLSAAVQNDRTRGNAILWHIYLDFEIRTSHLKQAKLLLFRAIKECPIAKELYLLAFGPLRSLFSRYELNKLGDAMVERGIRMRRALDEAVDGWTEPRVKLPEDSDGGEEEIEYNAQELRRLMPY